jgi:hypothetical protein
MSKSNDIRIFNSTFDLRVNDVLVTFKGIITSQFMLNRFHNKNRIKINVLMIYLLSNQNNFLKLILTTTGNSNNRFCAKSFFLQSYFFYALYLDLQYKLI